MLEYDYINSIINNKETVITLNNNNFIKVKEQYDLEFSNSTKVIIDNPHKYLTQYGYDYFVVIKQNHKFIFRTKHAEHADKKED